MGEKTSGAPSEDGAEPGRFRVMVVEDNHVNMLVATQLLAAIGGECATAENGEECLAMLVKGEFDVIVMDRHMPVMDGVAATAAIRNLDGPARDIPVIGCTADAFSDAREAMLGAGCSACLTKPLRIEGLSAAIAAVLGRGHSGATKA